MPVNGTAKRLYDDAMGIDGLNVSNWDSGVGYHSLRAGGVTAINATSAVWESFGRRWTISQPGGAGSESSREQ